MAQAKKGRYFISSLERGLAVLSTFSRERPYLTLSDLAQANKMTLGTATRYVVTLKELGYLTQDPLTKRYGLTSKVLSMGFTLLSSMDLRSRALPHMIKATEELNITTACAILEGTDIVYIERSRSTNVVNLDLTTGSRLPAYCTSLGRAILAFCDKKKIKEVLDQSRMVKYTPYTITDKKLLYQELEKTRKRGYADNNEELSLGLRGLAAPIFRKGEVEAAFGFSFPCHRLTDKKIEAHFIAQLLEIAQKCYFE